MGPLLEGADDKQNKKKRDSPVQRAAGRRRRPSPQRGRGDVSGKARASSQLRRNGRIRGDPHLNEAAMMSRIRRGVS